MISVTDNDILVSDYLYNGQVYSICYPDKKYYVTATNQPSDKALVFDPMDKLLDSWQYTREAVSSNIAIKSV